MQPHDHISTAVVYSVAPSNSSGDLTLARRASHQKLAAPIPQRHDELGHFAKWIAKLPGQTEICDFERPAVVHEQVGRLQIAV